MKYLVYPFSNSNYVIKDTLAYYASDIDIIEYVTPKTWIRNISNDTDVTTDFYGKLTSVDSVIFLNSFNNKYMYEDILEKMMHCIECGKDIICCTPIKSSDLKTIEQKTKEKRVAFIYYGIPKMDYFKRRVFQDQDCIVIGIGNMLNGLDDFTIISKLVYRYRVKGYRVTAVSTNSNSGLLGFLPFPIEVLTEDSLPYAEKIKTLNSFFNNIQVLHQPDILIVQLPYGMIKCTDICVEDFGVNAFIVSQSLNIDYFILNTPLEELDTFSFEEMKKAFKYRFGIPLTAIGVENKYINYTDSNEEESIIYEKADEKDVQNYVNFLKSANNEDIYYFNIQSTSEYDMLIEHSINLLSGEE